jgi:hypothetical protein
MLINGVKEQYVIRIEKDDFSKQDCWWVTIADIDGGRMVMSREELYELARLIERAENLMAVTDRYATPARPAATTRPVCLP